MLDLTKEFKEVKIISAVSWYILTMVIVIFIPIILGYDNLLENDNLLSLLSSSLFIAIMLFKFRLSPNKLILLIKDYKQKVNIKELLGVVGTQLCLSMGISLLVIGIVYFKFPDFLNELLTDSAVDSYSTYSGLVTVMLITVVCAPLAEEMLFRAVIFKRTSKKFNIYVGIIVSSLIFGLLHIELAIIGAFLFGVACCILYTKYRNILIPMTVHFLNNLIAFLPQIDISAPVETAPLTASDAQAYLGMGGILFLIGMFFFIKFVNKNKHYLKKGFASSVSKSPLPENPMK
ncbi:MAG: type II CAAX endopeptidase family protein [Terrisporobacter sp.]|uniref:CPBP family intramembrane glutamic endopeptidase n=1 Tax=Terrisporobacter sp. TaxID=1965305 RepID=UPI002FC61261